MSCTRTREFPTQTKNKTTFTQQQRSQPLRLLGAALLRSMPTIKVSYGEEIRRFTADQLTFDELCATLREFFGLAEQFPFVIKYLDDESDWIRITSNHELQIGFRACPSLMKLRIEEQKEQVQTPPQTLTPADASAMTATSFTHATNTVVSNNSYDTLCTSACTQNACQSS